MSDVEYIANMAEIISGLAVIIGIGFGVVEYRRHKAKERRETVANLARSFQTQELAAAIRVVLELPGPIDSEQYKTLSRRDKNLLWMMFCSMESIGILVYRGDLTLGLVDEFFSIPGPQKRVGSDYLNFRSWLPHISAVFQHFERPISVRAASFESS